MTHLVKTKYLMKEISNSAQFRIGWQAGETFVKFPKGYLTRNHIISIYVYSDNNVYKSFNSDNRYGKNQYKHKTYKWYSLYFLLTEAIQILKKTQYGCRLTALKGQISPLDMALDSVYNQYEGCREKMAQKVKTVFLKEEINNLILNLLGKKVTTLSRPKMKSWQIII